MNGGAAYRYGIDQDDLISCDDIGMRPQLIPGELDDAESAMEIALKHLGEWPSNAMAASHGMSSLLVSLI